MSRAKVWGRALVVAVSLAMICASRGLAQQQTGDLFGTVVDEQKAPLPGVTVTLTGVGAPQVQQTDEGGRFRFDGVVLTDMNAVGGSATYFDFGAFEEVQFTTSSSDVSVATAGVTINQVTKRGTNAWRVNGRYLRTDGSLQSEPDLPNGNKIDNV